VVASLTVSRFAGFALVALSAASFGIMPIFARFAYADGAGTTTMLFLRFSIGGLFLLGVMKLRRIAFPRGRQLLGFALMGAVGYTGQSFCYFTALKYASAGLVALMLYVYPALVTLLSVLFLHQRLSGRTVAALALALAGTALIVGLGSSGQARGVLLGLGAAGIYAVYIICGSRLIGPGMAIPSSGVIMLAAALMFGGFSAAGGLQLPHSAFGIAAIAAIALISTVVALVTFFAGMERVGPTNASMISTIEPVVTVTAAAVFLGEPIRLLNVVGGCLILGSLAILASSPAQEKQER